MRASLPQNGITPVIFFLVASVGIGAFMIATNSPAQLWQSTELGRTRVPAMLEARAIRIETVRRGRGHSFARVQASAVYESQGVSHKVTRVGVDGELIANGLWQKWDARQAAGDMRVEVSISRSDASDVYIAPPGLERNQLPALVGLLVITGISFAVLAGLVSSVVNLVRQR